MKKISNKNKIMAIAFVLTLTMSLALVTCLQPVIAQEPYRTKKTFAYIGAVPNPVGVNQTVLLHVGITDYLLIEADGWEGLWVTIERPDNQTETIEDIRTDSTGGTGVTYKPDQEGTYYLQTHFPEQNYNWTQVPAFNPSLFGMVTYLASESEILELIVQKEPVEYHPGFASPTEYWTRPIDAQLREWSTVSGSWFEERPNLFAPYNDGPETAHILWAKPLIRGGLSGGETGEHAHDCGDAYRGRWQSSVIIEGVLYYNRFPSSFFGPLNPQQGIVAVDLHTGEELWVRNNTMVAFGQTMYWSSLNMHGTFSYLWETVGDTWNAYDPLTGEWVYTMTNVPSRGVMFGASYSLRGPNGGIIIYTVDVENGWMTKWNSSNIPALYGLPDPNIPGFGFFYYTWLPEGKIVDASAGYEWNVTIPEGLPGDVIWTFEDRIIGSNIGISGGVAPPELAFWGISTKPETKGTLLFNTTWTTPPGDVEIRHVTASLEDGVFVFWVKDTREHYGFSLENGKKLWGPSKPQHYLDALDDTPDYARDIAYGKLYSASVSGIVYCYNVKTGELLWTYEAYDPYQEVLWANNWWLRPVFITDGKIYVGHTEHSAIDPKPRGGPFICLNATTGDEIWRVDGMFRQTRWGGRAIIGDSIIATMDTYDQRVYAIGKGPSATTVSIQNDVIPHGSSVIIKGTVTDVSPGTKEYALTARFPNGVPAVAGEDMSEWMLYVYKQFPIPIDVTGVPVSLDTLDPNGNFIHIGDVTTDGYSGTFGFMFTPEVPGTYTIMATFIGDESYGSSFAQTYLGVGEAPEPYPEPPEYGSAEWPAYPEAPAYTAVDLAIIIAIVIVAFLVLYTLWTVRKQR